MPDRSFPAVDNLIRRAQRAAAGRSDPARILAQTISIACPGGADPYAVLGVLVEGTASGAHPEGTAGRNCCGAEATAGRGDEGVWNFLWRCSEVASAAGSPQVLIRLSRDALCSHHLVISEQRLDFLASLPRVGGENCLLMQDDAHLRVNTTSLGETFRQEP
jgi:hypothetical protein